MTTREPVGEPGLEARRLVRDYRIRSGLRTSTLHAVADVSFTIRPGRTIALVGESGSGKSTVARILSRLETTTSGGVLLDGVAAPMRGAALERYRSRVQLVFQDPFASLNPFHTILHHIERPLRIHNPRMSASEVRSRAHELLERVQLTPSSRYADRRPHELSGGQRQRVAIARALAPGATYIVADEPVSMLDVSVRTGVLELLDRLRREHSMGILMITHDLSTAAAYADRIVVMRAGRIVEEGDPWRIVHEPAEPYTRRLLASVPSPDPLQRRTA